MQLKLYTPQPGQALLQSPETRPEVASEWIRKLHVGNPEDSAQKLLAELGRLNRCELDEALRSELIQIYEPLALKLIEAIVVTLPENGTPQSTVHRHTANLACELSVELAHAWKMAYRGLEQRRSLFGGTKARHQTLGHLLAALSRQIWISYRTYTSPPAHSWRELHQVHAALKASGTVDAGPGAAEAENAYKRTLLLALADPFRFTRPELEVAMAYLDRFGQLAQLGSASPDRHPVFHIGTESDTPFQQVADSDRGLLALDTHELCKHLRSFIVRLKTGEAFREIGFPDVPQKINGLHLFIRLHQSWRGASRRGFARYETVPAHVEVVCGLDAIHKLLEAKPAAVPLQPDEPPHPTRWRVVNDSASGLAMSAQAQEVPQVRMGNPIALRERDLRKEAWTLGVIRWGKMSKGQVVMCGVEKLSPNAAAVVLRFTEGHAAQLGQPALLIPANPALQTGERVMLPRGLYKRALTADMWHNGEVRRIGLGSLVEETVFFDIAEVLPAP